MGLKQSPITGDYDPNSIYVAGDFGKRDKIQFNTIAANLSDGLITDISIRDGGGDAVTILYEGVAKKQKGMIKKGQKLNVMIRTMIRAKYNKFLKNIQKARINERKQLENENK